MIFLLSLATVLSVVAFAGVLIWALSDARRARFEEDARLPFALTDEREPPISETDHE